MIGTAKKTRLSKVLSATLKSHPKTSANNRNSVKTQTILIVKKRTRK